VRTTIASAFSEDATGAWITLNVKSAKPRTPAENTSAMTTAIVFHKRDIGSQEAGQGSFRLLVDLSAHYPIWHWLCRQISRPASTNEL
jgi:hypothetical protein